MDWTSERIDFLKLHYPQKGKMWCAAAMGATEAQIRQKAARLKLRAMGTSEAWHKGQKKAAAAKIGKEKPGQSLVMKRLHDEGKLKKSFEDRSRASKLARKKATHLPTYTEHPRGMKGKKHTDMAKKKIGIAAKKSWRNVTEEQLQQRNLLDRSQRG